MAEYPPAREKFKQALAKLKEMAEKMVISQPLVAEHAQIAVNVIEWTPWNWLTHKVPLLKCGEMHNEKNEWMMSSV